MLRRTNPITIIPLLSLLSGILLLPAFSQGLTRIDSFVFRSFWFLHVGFQCVAVMFVVYAFYHLVQKAEFGKLLYSSSFFFFLSVIIFLSILPITARDALIYQLETPKLWIEQGRISEIPWLEWSYFPMQIGVGYAGFLLHGLERFTALYHASYLLLTCGVVLCFIHTFLKDVELSILSFLLCLSLPVCLKVGSSPMADLGLALYFGIGFFYAAKVLEERKFISLFLATLALGLALSTKYNGLLGLAIFLPLFFIFLKRSGSSPKQSFLNVFFVFISSLLICAPWLIRNYLWTGNPVHPFLGGLFGGNEAVPFMGTIKPFTYRILAYKEDLFDLLLLPFRVIFFGEDDNPKQFDGVLTPLFLLALVPLFYLRSLQKSPVQKTWFPFFYLFVAIYFVSSVSLFYLLIRYLSPVLLPIMVLTALGIYCVKEFIFKERKQLVYQLCFGTHLIFSLCYSTALMQKTHALSYLFSTQSPKEYLQNHLSEYSMIEFINTHISKTKRIYLLYTGNRYYYYDVPVRGGYFSGDKVLNWIHAASSAKDIYEKFQSEGITHLMLHGRRTADVFKDLLNEKEQILWMKFIVEHTSVIHKDKGYSLLELNPTSEKKSS